MYIFRNMDSEACVQRLLQVGHEDFEGVVEYCTSVIQGLHPYINSLSKMKKKGVPKGKTNKKAKRALVGSDRIPKNIDSGLKLSSTNWDPVGFLSIGELTEHVTSPPGYTCSEAIFGKAFAIFGVEFARSVFKIVKGTEVSSLESLARWTMIKMLEDFCRNILASGTTPAFDEGPDPVLFCPVYDSSELRFGDSAFYPTTVALSNLVKKFVQDIDFYRLTNFSHFPDGHYLPVSFHTDLCMKQNMLSAAVYEGDWLNISHLDSILKRHEHCGDQALVYALVHLKRAQCFYAMNKFFDCVEDCGTVLRVPAEISNGIKALANLLKAKSQYQIAKDIEEGCLVLDKESNIWKTQLQYLKWYRSAALSFAYVLELSNETEFNSEMHECNVEMITSLHKVLAAQRADCQLKTCCLCWKNSQLCGSHIFPRFILEALRSEVGILVGNALKGPRQVNYPMLCDECEQRFCNWGETPFKNFFFVKVHEQPSVKLDIYHGPWLYYFFASLMWRIQFVMKYKAFSFSEMLGKVPFFLVRRFLLTYDIQHLTSDCFLYLFFDKDEFDEEFCKTSLYKSYARKGGGYSFDPDQHMFICYFLNYYLVFPICTLSNSFLMQGPLKRLRFGEGVFVIEADLQRSMPVFLEYFLCKSVAREYDSILSSLTHQTYKKISQSQEKESSSFVPKVIRCLPSDVSVTFNPSFKYGIELQGGFGVKCSPIDCRFAEEPGKRYTLYLCEDGKGNYLALYHIYGIACDHLYAFQLTGGEVSKLTMCDNIKNKQYFDMLLVSNPGLQGFLMNLVSAMSEAPTLDVHFFPKDASEISLKADGSLNLPVNFSDPQKPIKFKNMTFWLSEHESYGEVIIWRLFCEVAYDEMPTYNNLVALQFQSEGGKVKSIEPLCPPKEMSGVDLEINQYLLDFKPICLASVQLLQDHDFRDHGIVSCLPDDVCVDFFPIDKAKSTDNLVILNELGSVSDPFFNFFSWLCSYTEAFNCQKSSCLAILQKWNISNLYFAVLFYVKSSEGDSPLTFVSTPNVPHISIFKKMVEEYCPNDFNTISRNILLSVKSYLKLNSRVRSIFTTGHDPMIQEKAELKDETEVILPLDSIVCLPSGCAITNEEGTKLHLSADYHLLCTPLETPLYTVWLCVYKDVQDFVVVRTTSGIDGVCSSVVVALDFVAAPEPGANFSACKFKFYPSSHLNSGDTDFVEADFLAGETFQSIDCNFSVLMACVQILLSQMYQSYNLQVYLPAEFHVDMGPEDRLQILYPYSIVAGPLHQEGASVTVTCWLCDESLGIVKVKNKSMERQYLTAVTFEYSGSSVSKLELVDLPPGLQFIVQYYLYLEKNLSFLIASMLKTLFSHYTMGEVA